MANNAENWGNQKKCEEKNQKIAQKYARLENLGGNVQKCKRCQTPPPAQVHPPVLGTGMQPTENRK